MYSPIFARFRSTLVVLTVALSLVLVPQVARPAVVAAAPAQQSGVVGICGAVSGFQPAGASSAGAITIGTTHYTIAQNVSLTLSGVTPQNGTLNGLNLCFQLTLSAGVITAGTVTPNTMTTPTVCGTVTAYVPGQSITINVNGTTEVFSIAAGATASGPALALLATANPGLCFGFTLNGLGQVTNAYVTSNTATALNVCGVVSLYQAATTSAAGAITIAGRQFAILASATPTTIFTGAAAAQLGTANPNLCFQLTLNGLGQIMSGVVTAKTTPATTGNVQLCGLVTLYAPAGAANTTATGTLVIGGQTLMVAAGVVPAGSAIAAPGYYCLTIALNGSGQIAALSVVPTMVPVNYVCGAFTTFGPATTTASAAYIVGGMVFPVSSVMFATVTGSLVANQVYCFRLLNGAIVGLLSTVPTAATPAETSGARYRVGGHWVD